MLIFCAFDNNDMESSKRCVTFFLSITYTCNYTHAYSVKPGKTWFNNLWIIHSLQLNKPDTKIKTGSMGHDRNWNK